MMATAGGFAREKGLTIVEMMVALALSLFLLAGITYVVVNSNRSYNTTDSFSRLQENARFAMEFLARDLRRAGYVGCANDVNSVNSTLNDGAMGPGLSVFPIEGVDDIGTNSVWAGAGDNVVLSHQPIAGSDAIRIRYADLSNPIAVVKEMPNESAVVFVNPGHGLKIGDIIALTDCNSTDIMQLTNVDDSGSSGSGMDNLVHNAGGTQAPGNRTQKLSKMYGEGATVLKFQSYVYYVATNDNGRRALFRESSAGAQELVEGVESMQIRYGLADSFRAPARYSQAVNTIPWTNDVVSVQIGLLMSTMASTEDGQYGIDKDTGTYDVNGTNVTPPQERRLRKVFSTTISLRNLRKL